MDKKEYIRVHNLIKKNLGKASVCQINRYHKGAFDWANISRTYKTDSDDWIQLCKLCHRTFDLNKWNLSQLIEWENKRRIYIYPQYLNEPFIALSHKTITTPLTRNDLASIRTEYLNRVVKNIG